MPVAFGKGDKKGRREVSPRLQLSLGIRVSGQVVSPVSSYRLAFFVSCVKIHYTMSFILPVDAPLTNMLTFMSIGILERL